MINKVYQLSFKDNQWVCYNSDFTCTANELKDIDNQIINDIKTNNIKGMYQIEIHFDFDVFPVWMRQYMPHYFNRKFTVEL